MLMAERSNPVAIHQSCGFWGVHAGVGFLSTFKACVSQRVVAEKA